jgi:hypothetical protein
MLFQATADRRAKGKRSKTSIVCVLYPETPCLCHAMLCPMQYRSLRNPLYSALYTISSRVHHLDLSSFRRTHALHCTSLEILFPLTNHTSLLLLLIRPFACLLCLRPPTFQSALCNSFVQDCIVSKVIRYDRRSEVFVGKAET